MKTKVTHRISDETLKNIEGLRALKVGKSDADVIEKAVKFFLEAQNDSQKKLAELYEHVCRQISFFENIRDWGRDVRVEETMSIMPNENAPDYSTIEEKEYLNSLYKCWEAIRKTEMYRKYEVDIINKNK